MKKQAFGIIQLLFVIVICYLIFTVLHPKIGRNNPFEEVTNTNTKVETVSDNKSEIEETKAIKKQIKENLKDKF